MKIFLENNDPWKQLIHTGNINLIELKNNEDILLNEKVSTPLKP